MKESVNLFLHGAGKGEGKLFPGDDFPSPRDCLVPGSVWVGRGNE